MIHHWRMLPPLIATTLYLDLRMLRQVSAFTFSATALKSRERFETECHSSPKHHPLRAATRIGEGTSSSLLQWEKRISAQEAIESLTKHPAVYWNETTTFSSLHSKKLRMRHVDLFAETDDYR